MLIKIKDYIKTKIENIFEYLMRKESQNIERELQRIALRETCLFILESGLIKSKAFKDRFELLKYSISQISIKDGLILEFGVYKGETINFIADLLKDKTIYGFDSFEGLPETWRFDFEKGTFKIDKIPTVRQNVKLIKCWFHETLPKFISEIGKTPVSFMHIDCDLYSSTKVVLENLKNKMAEGTIIVFDEFFNYPGWKQGEYKAWMEFVSNESILFEYLGFCKYHEQVAVKITRIRR
jgi:hypothetical protein